MSTIDKDLAALARREWPAGKQSASITSDGISAEYYDYPVSGKYTYQQYLHARHVLGLDDEVKEESNMHPDLEWLARNVSDWGSALNLGHIGKFWDGDSPMADYVPSMAVDPDGRFRANGHRAIPVFSKAQWLQARQDLGLVMSDEEAELPAEEHRNKYMREIKPGVWVDVYDVLNAWAVKNPALQHLIKKALAPGQRGHKTMEQDMNDIVASALRARELVE